MPTTKVLMIDDDEGLSQFIAKALSGMGPYKVKSCCNGEEGLEAAHAYAPDVIVLDINMPHLSGIEVLQRLKEDEATMFIPVLMLTGEEGDSMRIQAACLYCEDFLVKPITMEQLEAQIRRIVTLQR